MASGTPMAVVRDVSSSPHHSRGAQVWAGKITAGGSHSVVLETRLKGLLFFSVTQSAAGTEVSVTEAASTAYPNTRKLTFSVSGTTEYCYLVIGNADMVVTPDSTGGTTTITFNPITG